MQTLLKTQEIVVLAASYARADGGEGTSEVVLNFAGEPTRADIRQALQAEVEATYLDAATADTVFDVLDRNIGPDGDLFPDSPEAADGKPHIVMNDEFMMSRKVLLHPVSSALTQA